jgi:hypothetical protein
MSDSLLDAGACLKKKFHALVYAANVHEDAN